MGGWLMELLEPPTKWMAPTTPSFTDGWLTLEDYVKWKRVHFSTDCEFEKIIENIYKATRYINAFEFSIFKIEHASNIMVNTNTENIKFVDVDGLYLHPFENTRNELSALKFIFESLNIDLPFENAALESNHSKGSLLGSALLEGMLNVFEKTTKFEVPEDVKLQVKVILDKISSFDAAHKEIVADLEAKDVNVGDPLVTDNLDARKSR